MKATGIVRRVDDLGRVVIPREIRRSMGIEDGEPLEIFVGDNKIIFQKYGKQIDWVKAYCVVNAIMPENVTFALYDENGKRQSGHQIDFAHLIQNVKENKTTYPCNDDSGIVFGYIVADNDKEIDWELAGKVLRAFIED